MDGFGVPATPFGFDLGLPVFISDDDLAASVHNMTAEELEAWERLGHATSDFGSPIDYLSSAASDTFRSPGKQSQYLHSTTGASSSLSPRDRPATWTPSPSALHDFGEVLQVEDPTSPETTSSTPESSSSPSSGEYGQVRHDDSRSQGRSRLALRPQPMPGSGASTSAQHSHLHNIVANTSHTASFATGSWTMDGSGAWGHLDHTSYPPQVDTDIATGLDSFDTNHLTSTASFGQSTQAFDDGANFRSFGNEMPTFNQAPLTHDFDTYATQIQTMSHERSASATTLTPAGRVVAHYRGLDGAHFVNVQQYNQFNGMMPSLPQQAPLTPHAHRQLSFIQTRSLPQQMASTSMPLQPQGMIVEDTRTATQDLANVQQAVAHHLRTRQAPLQQVSRRPQHAAGISAVAHGRRLPALAPGSNCNKPESSQASRPKGGRKKNTPLAEGVRQQSGNMRRTVACWRCAFQRDTCPDGNSPCGRCVTAYADGKIMMFPCTRAKLPTFVLDFLPPSMTGMHQKQSIEDYMNAKVSRWHKDTATDIYLTCGHGPALRWKLYEFTPTDDEPCWQLQYLQVDGRSEARQKYSPPFAMMKFDMSDDAHIDEFMDEMLLPRYLTDFGWTCFEEETPINDFQAQVLQAMCTLYTTTKDPDLHNVLRKILRMTALTYIMGHTLTLIENTTYGVLRGMKYAKVPSHAVPTQHVSPRLANRQLKLFFSLHREKVYKELLNWQQQTLHASKSKEEFWLPAFCVTLGLAMVLEEVQRTIWVQADAKVKKDESITQLAADTEAYNACSRIDERCDLLGNLFRAKYRAKKWRTAAPGSFGPATPHLPEYEAHNFLNDVYALLVNNKEHLRMRKDVPLSSENQCFYTSRLVARFLLPFLDGPTD